MGKILECANFKTRKAILNGHKGPFIIRMRKWKTKGLCWFKYGNKHQTIAVVDHNLEVNDCARHRSHFGATPCKLWIESIVLVYEVTCVGSKLTWQRSTCAELTSTSLRREAQMDRHLWICYVS